MPSLPQFDPPAMQNDFPDEPAKYRRLVDLWTRNLDGYTEQSIVGNPWNALYSSNQTFYYNPLTTEIPPEAKPVTHAWFAFPNRIVNYFSSLTQAQQWEFADNGFLADGTPIPLIPTSDAVCAGKSTPTTLYGPFGPRGWQDEYCEWSVTRNAQGKIVRVDFACENPEYWYTLWRIDPDRAAAIYAETLGKPVRKQDLYLTDGRGNPVIDPATGLPAYNPLNKWNCGTVSTPTSGGAMHLTSTPNTLQTEIGLAGLATVLRRVGNQNAQRLLCCSQYGQPQRNSDPSIGQTVNLVVEGPPASRISLANPVGLYIQMPSFGGYQLPPNAPAGVSPADFWKIVRGQLTLPGFPAGTNFILHATYEVPAEYGFTVGDMTIQGNPIAWGSMIAQTFQVALNPLAISASERQEPLPCVDATSQPPPKAQPLQIMPLPLWQAYYSTPVQNPRQVAMNLASNTTITPPAVAIGSSMTLALTCATVLLGPRGELPVVEFTLPDTKQADPNIAVSVRSLEENITYAVPGNTYPSEYQLLTLEIQVAHRAAAGPRGVRITNHGQAASEPAPYFLLVTQGGV